MTTTLAIGFIPLADCAVLAVAREKGFAEAEGLHLHLVRENSWANIRDRLLVGHFDAAHMLGPMAVAMTLGVRHVAMPVVAPFALGLGGNAITVTTALRQEMHRCAGGDEVGASSVASAGRALRAIVAAREASGGAPLTFGMVYPFSSHNYLIRYWLAASGIDPDRAVRLGVMPPSLLVDAMKAGQLDGFCVGEPWNSVAVEAGVGSIVMPTTAIWRRSPEKVLGCRADWAQQRGEHLDALLRCLHHASLWCGDLANRAELAGLLSSARYVDAPPALLRRGIEGQLVCSPGGAPVEMKGFQVHVDHAATLPQVNHALWFYSQMVRWGQCPWSAQDVSKVAGVFRPDLYRSALEPLGVTVAADVPSVDGEPDTGFFDGVPFDAGDLLSYGSRFAIASARH